MGGSGCSQAFGRKGLENTGAPRALQGRGDRFDRGGSGRTLFCGGEGAAGAEIRGCCRSSDNTKNSEIAAGDLALARGECRPPSRLAIFFGHLRRTRRRYDSGGTFGGMSCVGVMT